MAKENTAGETVDSMDKPIKSPFTHLVYKTKREWLKIFSCAR